MVHYYDFQRTSQPVAMSCPKCGGHRTESAGRSRNGRGVDLRCNDCDEQFPLTVDRRAGDGDNMTDEVEAIRAVGKALAQLPDSASRVRVLRWAAERFRLESALAPAPAPAAAAVDAAPAEDGPDLTLSVEGLSDFFTTTRPQERAQLVESDSLTFDAVAPAAADPIAQLDAIDSIDALVPPAADAAAAEAKAEKPAESAPTSGSVLHSFVHDFQRLANDCQTLFST